MPDIQFSEGEVEVKSIRFGCFSIVFLAVTVSASLVAPIHFGTVNSQVVEQRLKSYKGTDSEREITIKNLFQSAGCDEANLLEQPVKRWKTPNVICTLSGGTDSVIVVGAHFDHVDAGDGVVDNWSGASLLPSLYQALKSEPRKHTFIFVAFAAEENGLVGSRFYADSLAPDQVKRIDAMVNIDTLGLGPTEVWVSHSEPKLVHALKGMAESLQLPLTGVNVDGVGKSDEESFIARNIPTVTVHSLTKETLSVLHSPKDNYSAIHFDDYYKSYRLLSAYLVLLDSDWRETE
jgi:Zn-dependent M28 family amino/carboxypeptidase